MAFMDLRTRCPLCSWRGVLSCALVGCCEEYEGNILSLSNEHTALRASPHFEELGTMCGAWATELCTRSRSHLEAVSMIMCHAKGQSVALLLYSKPSILVQMHLRGQLCPLGNRHAVVDGRRPAHLLLRHAAAHAELRQ